jgi:mercuric ion transport protein
MGGPSLAVTETRTPIAQSSDKPFVASTSWLAGLGATVGLGGLLASSCCVVPMALAGLGAGGAAFSGLEFLATWRIYFIAGAALALAIGWVMFFRQRSIACGPCADTMPARRVATLLSVGTAFVALSYVWDPLIEPMLLRFVRQ